MSFTVSIYSGTRLVHSAEFSGLVELGRQRDGDPRPFGQLVVGGVTRIVIAPQPETHIARDQLQVRPLADGRLGLKNVSRSISVQINGQTSLDRSADEIVVDVPVRVQIGRKTSLLFEAVTASHLDSLQEPTRAPGEAATALARLGSRYGSLAQTPERTQEDLVSELQTALEVLQGARTANELFVHAISSAKVLVAGLDRVDILLHQDGQWQSSASPDESTLTPPSRSVLRSVLESKKTYWSKDIDADSRTESLAAVQSVIASPILDAQRNVIGALYGDRMQGLSNPTRAHFRNLDARVFELLACCVATGWERQRHEDDARRIRLQFEQFFTESLTRNLAANPRLLEGREADVSILFCDIRGFSRISKQIGPANTFAWMNDVLTRLSDCVIRHDGVLVDYIGDELMAMWGAPQEDQTNHAELACRAAFDILDQLSQLNVHWQPRLGEPMELGIGINTGRVCVGNSGSERKFKYGPLGNPVNLASRLQGATKYLKTRLLITGETQKALDGKFAERELCTVRVVNLDEPVPVFELAPARTAEVRDVTDSYQRALAAFVDRKFPEAVRLLAGHVDGPAADGPSMVLLSRAVKAMTEGPDEDHPVWKLPGK